jgi:hypothetical protein
MITIVRRIFINIAIIIGEGILYKSVKRFIEAKLNGGQR